MESGVSPIGENCHGNWWSRGVNKLFCSEKVLACPVWLLEGALFGQQGNPQGFLSRALADPVILPVPCFPLRCPVIGRAGDHSCLGL
jgi:hypothetical protein